MWVQHAAVVVLLHLQRSRSQQEVRHLKHLGSLSTSNTHHSLVESPARVPFFASTVHTTVHWCLQAVVQNLMISRIEFRDDTDPDVVKYCHPRSREQRLVPVCQEGRLIRQLLRKLMTPLAMRLNSEAEVGAIGDIGLPLSMKIHSSIIWKG
jgi:hypothetical protein